MPIAGSARTAPFNRVFLAGIRSAIMSDPDWKNGFYGDTPPVKGVRQFARVYAGWGFSEPFYRQGLYKTVFGSPSVEDFVETFAVWLTPGLDWRSKYAGWKALDKLLFVDKLMASIAGKPPLRATGRQLWKITTVRSTLRRYYQKRRITEAEDFPEFHDANLRRMFSEGDAKNETRRPVAKLLQSHRKSLLTTVSNWTGERRFMVNEVYKAVLQRSRALHLVTEDPDTVALLQLATYLTTLMMNYRYTTRLRGEL